MHSSQRCVRDELHQECSAAGLLVELRLHLLELVFESGLLVLELSSRFLRGRRQLRVLLLDFNFVYFFLRPALSLRERREPSQEDQLI